MFERQSLSIGALGMMLSLSALAQAPAGAPSGATGICKDGSYWTGASKRGACSGHHGVQTWYGDSSQAPAATPAPSANSTAPAPAAPAPTAAPAPASPSPASTAAAARQTTAPTATQASGAAPGLVWLNTSSNVYHCSSDRYYGKTKNGSYMTEADALAKGAHPDHGKACK